MKRMFLISALLLSSFVNIVAQDATLSIPNLVEVSGTEVLVPINITSLNTVGSMTLNIKFDSSVMSYTGDVENNSISGGFFNTGTKGDTIVTVSWFGSPAINMANGKLFDLKFNYFGGNSEIEFNFIEITNNRSVPYTINSNNGTISAGVVPPAKIELNDVNGVPGDTVSVNISGADLVNIGSMNLYIAYNPTAVRYIGIGGTNLPNFISNAADGIVSLGMFTTFGFSHSSGIMANLKFELLNETSNLTFQPNCQVSDKDLNIIVAEYTNGSITVSDSEMYLSHVTSRANENLGIAFNGRNLTNIGSFNLDIDFDETSLTFIGVDDATGGIFTTNVVGGVLKLGYINSSGLTMSDNTIAELQFSYTGGNSDLVFNMATADVQNTLFEAVAVLFNDGSVTEQPNQVPSFINTLPDTTIAESETLTYLYTSADLDGDALTFALVVGPDGSTMGSDGSFSWTPSFDQAGKHVIVTSLTDGIDMAHDTTQITVTETNRAPYFTNSLPDTTIVEMEILTYLYMGVDPDGDALAFSLESGPTGAVLNANGNFSWTPNSGDVGVYELVVAGLSDGQIMVYDTASITVLIATEAPFFTVTMPDTTVTEGNILSYQYEGEDPDGDALTFAIESAPDGATISSGGTFYWTPSTPEDISATIIISLTDQVATVYDTTEIYVLTDIDVITSNIPEEFTLGQNYPNPFNPSTTINYSLPESAMVNLTVYDITGQEIETLLNSEIAAGFHRISFNASKLAGGVYLYRIMATNSSGLNFLNTKKMLLIK